MGSNGLPKEVVEKINLSIEALKKDMTAIYIEKIQRQAKYAKNIRDLRLVKDLVSELEEFVSHLD